MINRELDKSKENTYSRKLKNINSFVRWEKESKNQIYT